MDRKQSIWNGFNPCVIFFLVVFTLAGCGTSRDLASEVSGKWQPEEGSGQVEIKLAKDSSSFIIDDHTYKGVVEDIDDGTNTIHVKVETQNGKTELWSLHQIWDDNGSTFKLRLRRNGTTTNLTPVERS